MNRKVFILADLAVLAALALGLYLYAAPGIKDTMEKIEIHLTQIEETLK